MKKILISLGIFFLLVNSSSALAGFAVGQSDALVTPNPTTQPNSSAYGKSPSKWLDSYLRWLLEGAAIPGGNAAFLPIFGDSPFDIHVKAGTSMVLPIAVYIGFEGEEPYLPEDFYGVVTLDGQSIAEPNEDYYVEEMNVEPPIIGLGVFYQGLVVIINPLTPGTHTIELYSTIDGGTYEFNNTWIITVAR